MAHYRALVRVRVGERFTIELLDRAETTGHVWIVETLGGVLIVMDEPGRGRFGQRRMVTLRAMRAGEGEVRLCEQATRETAAPASTWTGRVSVDGRRRRR